MLFCGFSKVFSTKDSGQYESIGEFWDAMAEIYGRENLRGLGYGWTEETITYVIGLKRGNAHSREDLFGAVYCEITLPDDGWLRYIGRTEQLSALYDTIYAEGALQYEIEAFSDDGTCEIRVIRA